jgi:hypothetical protein
MGTYIVTGASNSGKNYWLEEQLRLFFQDTRMENIFVFSTTGELNEDWDFLEEYKDTTTINHSASFKSIKSVVKRMERELRSWKKAGKSLSTWKADHRTMFIVNDFFGMGNLSAPTNDFNVLASKVRHLGGYLVLFTQHVSCLNPGIYTNSRALVVFDDSRFVWKCILKHCGMDIPLRTVRAHNSKEYQFVIIFKASESRFPRMTGKVLACRKLDQSRPGILYQLI